MTDKTYIKTLEGIAISGAFFYDTYCRFFILKSMNHATH